MYIDTKHTIWHRTYLNENATEEKVLKILNDHKKELKRGEDYELPLKDMISEQKLLYKSQELMSVSENHHEATVELYNDEHELIWNNQGHGG